MQVVWIQKSQKSQQKRVGNGTQRPHRIWFINNIQYKRRSLERLRQRLFVDTICLSLWYSVSCYWFAIHHVDWTSASSLEFLFKRKKTRMFPLLPQASIGRERGFSLLSSASLRCAWSGRRCRGMCFSWIGNEEWGCQARRLWPKVWSPKKMYVLGTQKHKKKQK